MPFGFLRNVDRQNLLTFIIDEHPQTIALILSHLPPAYGAEILDGLARPSGNWRSSAASPHGPDEPRDHPRSRKRPGKPHVERDEPEFEKAGGVKSVAEMLNVSDRATERALLEALAQEDPELVEEIRRLMFVFEDMGKLSDKDIQTVLKNVETSQWAMALKGASDALKQKILGNMSERAADMLARRNGIPGPGQALRRRSKSAADRRRRPPPRRRAARSTSTPSTKKEQMVQ